MTTIQLTNRETEILLFIAKEFQQTGNKNESDTLGNAINKLADSLELIRNPQPVPATRNPSNLANMILAEIKGTSRAVEFVADLLCATSVCGIPAELAEKLAEFRKPHNKPELCAASVSNRGDVSIQVL